MDPISFAYPSVDASTVVGQLQWFMCGFVYFSGIAAIALAIRLFRMAGKEGIDL